MAPALQPLLSIRNRQRRIPLQMRWLRSAAEVALPLCRGENDEGEQLLLCLEEVSIEIVSDAVIADFHMRFMQIPGATDVITFHSGDVVISAETAAARGLELCHSPEVELSLYIIHALLHLNGFDDTSTAAAARMHKVQDRLWKEVLRRLPPSITPS